MDLNKSPLKVNANKFTDHNSPFHTLLTGTSLKMKRKTNKPLTCVCVGVRMLYNRSLHVRKSYISFMTLFFARTQCSPLARKDKNKHFVLYTYLARGLLQLLVSWLMVLICLHNRNVLNCVQLNQKKERKEERNRHREWTNLLIYSTLINRNMINNLHFYGLTYKKKERKRMNERTNEWMNERSFIELSVKTIIVFSDHEVEMAYLYFTEFNKFPTSFIFLFC